MHMLGCLSFYNGMPLSMDRQLLWPRAESDVSMVVMGSVWNVLRGFDPCVKENRCWCQKGARSFQKSHVGL